MALFRLVDLLTLFYPLAERVAMLEKDLESAREDACYSQSQESAWRNVLSRRIEECNQS